MDKTPFAMPSGRAVVAACGFTMLTVGLAFAAPMASPVPPSTADDQSPTSRGMNPYEIIPALRVSEPVTKSISTAIGNSYGYCRSRVEDAYLVDCLGDQLKAIAQAMPTSGEYAAAQRILADTGAKLRRLAASNVAPAKPRFRAKGSVNGRSVTTSSLTPVRAPRIKSVNQQAAAILAEAETMLLRSAETSDRRLIAFAQMAKAVGSNKTLLRSA